MKTSTKVKIGIAIIIFLLASTVGVMAQQLANARRAASIAEANMRALTDTVVLYKTEVSTAASRFQLQQKINSDSIAHLKTALGQATRDRDLTHVALTDAEIQIGRLEQERDQALTELANVFSPNGRPERIAAFQFDSTFVQTDIVVVVPWDTAQSIEVVMVATYKPIPMTYSLSCTPQHDAVATFESPPGVVIRPLLGQVDDEVCHPKPRSFAVTLFKPDLGKILWSGAAFGAGWWLGKNSASSTVNVYTPEQHQGFTVGRRSIFSILTVEF